MNGKGAHADVPRSEEQKAQAVRLEAMIDMIRVLAGSEDRFQRGLRWDELVSLVGHGSTDPKRTLDDLVALKFVVSTTESGDEEINGDVRIKKLHEVYGTTFFGRKWLREQKRN